MKLIFLYFINKLLITQKFGHFFNFLNDDNKSY